MHSTEILSRAWLHLLLHTTAVDCTFKLGLPLFAHAHRCRLLLKTGFGCAQRCSCTSEMILLPFAHAHRCRLLLKAGFGCALRCSCTPNVVLQPFAMLTAVGCTELYLGGRGIEKLRGFEPYANLASLWLNDNKLKKINNLDANFRIKALYVQVGMSPFSGPVASAAGREPVKYRR